ncbi:MAG: hypothetical protein HY437_02540 [Candidatus Magasanikbacteria bacterium]|nr:hypothetical protein [Candidatus Magasanikbacteria bacterium]
MGILKGRERANFFEAVAVMLGTIVGAGVLGIPYAVARVGFGIGLVYLLGLGIVSLLLHVLLGEVIIRTKDTTTQLAGLAGTYLGRPGKMIMSGLFFFGTYSALLAYVIGEGEVLTALFGGSTFVWSLLFLAIGSFFLHRGLKTVKVVEFIMMIGLFCVVFGIAFFSAPAITLTNLTTPPDWVYLLLPYGVILFAFHGTAALPVARTLLAREPRLFKRAIIIASALSMALYILFTIVAVGVTGLATTEVATVGLGEALGPWVVLFGNVFAFFAMGTSFLALGTALHETYEWDYRVPPNIAWLLTVLVPLGIFVVGVRSFVGVISFAGALFISIEAILIVLMYWRARIAGDGARQARGFALRHAVVASIAVIGVFVAAALYSLSTLFI